MNKKGVTALVWIVIALIAAVSLGLVKISDVTGVFDKQQSLPANSPALVPQGSAALACVGELQDDTVSWDVFALDRGQPGTSLTETVRLKYNGIDLSTFSGGTAQTLAVAGEYEALVTATDYYGTIIKGTTPCTRDFDAQPTLGRSAGLTFTTRDQDGRLVTTEQNISIGVGQTVTYTITARGNRSKSYWSNPDLDYYYALLNINTTAFDTAVDETFVKNAENVKVPQSQTGTYESAFKVTGSKGLYDFGEQEVKIVVNADDTVEPTYSTNAGVTNSSVVGNGIIRVLFMDATYFVNTIKGLNVPIGDGVDDNAGTAIGFTDYTADLEYR